MKKILTLITLFYLLLPTDSFARFVVKDSVGTVVTNNQRYILHAVMPGETLSGIARRYQVDLAAVIAANPNIDIRSIRIGQVVRIPMQNVPVVPVSKIVNHVVQKDETLWSISKLYDAPIGEIRKYNNMTDNALNVGEVLQIKSRKIKLADNPLSADDQPAIAVEESLPLTTTNNTTGSTTTATDEETPWWAYQPIGEQNTRVLQVAHTIQPGESLQKISNEYNVSIEKLVDWNALSSPNQIKAGDRIIVGYEYINKSTGEKTLELGNPTTTTKVETNNVVEGSNIPLNKKVTVVGAVIKGNSATNTNKHLALHRTAQKGSYIKVVNPNSGRYTFVRVLGNLQTTDADQDVVIKLSKSACQSLGLVTDKFQIILEYND